MCSTCVTSVLMYIIKTKCSINLFVVPINCEYKNILCFPVFFLLFFRIRITMYRCSHCVQPYPTRNHNHFFLVSCYALDGIIVAPQLIYSLSTALNSRPSCNDTSYFIFILIQVITNNFDEQ